jgi:hypothetical protein
VRSRKGWKERERERERERAKEKERERKREREKERRESVAGCRGNKRNRWERYIREIEMGKRRGTEEGERRQADVRLFKNGWELGKRNCSREREEAGADDDEGNSGQMTISTILMLTTDEFLVGIVRMGEETMGGSYHLKGAKTMCLLEREIE